MQLWPWALELISCALCSTAAASQGLDLHNMGLWTLQQKQLDPNCTPTKHPNSLPLGDPHSYGIFVCPQQGVPAPMETSDASDVVWGYPLDALVSPEVASLRLGFKESTLLGTKKLELKVIGNSGSGLEVVRTLQLHHAEHLHHVLNYH